MKILREYLGGSEEIDLTTTDGWLTWVEGVCQDEEWAEELYERIDSLGVWVVNEDQPEFFERYTKIEEPVSKERTSDEILADLDAVLNGENKDLDPKRLVWEIITDILDSVSLAEQSPGSAGKIHGIVSDYVANHYGDL